MFLYGPSYSDAARTLAATPGPVEIAIAYLGRGAARQMRQVSHPRRILCDVLSGGTNPYEVCEIQTIPGVDIRHVDNLHAKVMVSNTSALVGSANFSENGVGWQDGMAGNLVEAGYRVTNRRQVKAIQGWFNGQWDHSKEITPGLIERAKINWLRRQAGRPSPAGDRFIIGPKNWRAYTDRGTKLIIWRSVPTRVQRALESSLPDDLARNSPKAHSSHRKLLDYYHDWGKHLDLGAGVMCLDVHYQRNGKVVCHGARRTLANGHQVISGARTVDVLEMVSNIDGQQFTRTEGDALADWLQAEIQRHYLTWCQDLNEPGDTGGVVVDLDRALDAAFGAAEETHTPAFEELFELASHISVPLGWRCVSVKSPGPEVRIGTGSRNLRRKETPALGRVNLRLSVRDGMVRCGSYLSPIQLAAYGTALRLSGAEGRHWVQWPVALTASLLPRILDATRDRLNEPANRPDA